MTPLDLKLEIEGRRSESKFFCTSNMRMFGDTMRNYGVRKTTITANFDRSGTYHEGGTPREVWELYRRKSVKHGLRSSAYFDPETFNQVFERIAT